MLIECERCRSIYELDPALLKPEGSKVRCTVCGQVFVAKPDSSGGTEGFSSKRPSIPPAEPKTESKNQKVEQGGLDDFLKELDLGTIKPSPAHSGKQESVSEIKEKVLSKEPPAAPKEIAKDRIKPYQFEPPSSKPSGKRTVLLLIALFLIGACGSIIYFAPELIPWKLPFLSAPETPQKDQAARAFTFNELKGSFLESPKAGRLFVVKGLVKNTDKAPRGNIMIKVSLLDGKGQNIRSLYVYAGNSYEEGELSQMDLQTIKAAMANKAGIDNSNLKVLPGGTIPFMAVFDNLPDNLSEFAVEAVGSKVVSQ